tara:strand:+ start:338 stop:676 length:339 start_codon:yes stop_codon:yes gene_type:complete
MIDTDKIEDYGFDRMPPSSLIARKHTEKEQKKLGLSKPQPVVVTKDNLIIGTLWSMAHAQLLAHAPDLFVEVKRLREQVKDLEYEVEHWKWELQTRMCPIEFDALVNGDEEE